MVVSTKTYGMLLSVCSKQIKPNRAIELLKRMKESGLKADASCYRHVMDANAQAGKALRRVNPEKIIIIGMIFIIVIVVIIMAIIIIMVIIIITTIVIKALLSYVMYGYLGIISVPFLFW